MGLKALGYLVFRGANSQKDLFRRDPAHPRVRGGWGLASASGGLGTAPASTAQSRFDPVPVACSHCTLPAAHPAPLPPLSCQVASLRTLPTERGTRLIISGWWGIARHINYTGDWLMGCAADGGAHAARGATCTALSCVLHTAQCVPSPIYWPVRLPTLIDAVLHPVAAWPGACPPGSRASCPTSTRCGLVASAACLPASQPVPCLPAGWCCKPACCCLELVPLACTGFAPPVTCHPWPQMYFLALLLHRDRRDDHACRLKYGQDWDKFCGIVK